MPDDWETIPEDEDDIDPEDQFPIESEFRDGSERVRDSDGKYKSLSIAIIEKNSNLNELTPERVADQFDVSLDTAKEQLAHVRAVYGPDDSPGGYSMTDSKTKSDLDDESSKRGGY